jgi:hypothetical protein
MSKGVFVEGRMRSDINDLDRPGTRGNACNISHTFVWKSVWATQSRQRSEWRAVVGERHGWPAAIPPGSLPRVFSRHFMVALSASTNALLGKTSLPEVVLFL